MTDESVDEFEEALREAEKCVECAAQLMSDEPQDTAAKREMWKALGTAASEIDIVIHNAYNLRNC